MKNCGNRFYFIARYQENAATDETHEIASFCELRDNRKSQKRFDFRRQVFFRFLSFFSAKDAQFCSSSAKDANFEDSYKLKFERLKKIADEQAKNIVIFLDFLGIFLEFRGF